MTFVIWVKLASSGSYRIWKDNIQLDVKEGDKVSVDVDTLVPNKQYDMKVMAQSTTPNGDIRSAPLYTTGLTRGQLLYPILELHHIVSIKTFLIKITHNY